MTQKILCLHFTFLPGLLAAQTEAGIEMADALHTSGKIYVVISVLGIIFSGIILYLILLDRKITRLEKEAKK